MRSARRRRERLMAEDPHCHWCGSEVVYYELAAHESMPGNFATIDHLHDRYSYTRRDASGEQRIVLACRACNHRRGEERTLAVPIETRRRWSRRYPLQRRGGEK